MNALGVLKNYGLKVSIKDNWNIQIEGFKHLQKSLRIQLRKYAKRFKQQILLDLRIQDQTIQDKHSLLYCPARCKQTGRCYGMAYFNTKPTKTMQQCIPSECQWADKVREYNEQKVKWGQKAIRLLLDNHIGVEVTEDKNFILHGLDELDGKLANYIKRVTEQEKEAVITEALVDRTETITFDLCLKQIGKER